MKFHVLFLLLISLISLGSASCRKDKTQAPSSERSNPPQEKTEEEKKKEEEERIRKIQLSYDNTFKDHMYKHLNFYNEIPLLEYIKKVVKTIETYTWNDISFKFDFYGTSNLEEADIILFGDLHPDYSIQTDIAITANYLLSSRNPEDIVVLLEGDEAVLSYNDSSPLSESCSIPLLSTIPSSNLFKKDFFLIKGDFTKNPGAYAVEIMNLMLDDRYYKSFYNIYHDLSLFHGACYYWDSREGLNTKNHLKRNEQMVKMIDYFYKRNKKIFVIAGMDHLPSEEARYSKDEHDTLPILNYIKDKKYVEIVKTIPIRKASPELEQRLKELDTKLQEDILFLNKTNNTQKESF